ncbi:acyltransferase family protein [Olleya namhaensis]|uniref:acyltransferase family protein n=1 Tax=Olleya namhaensis TaxID=1144750 RepID=UPI00232DEC7F|nr:acyltransferase [Olleya namhaensis]
MESKTIYFKGLNGIRAIAAIVVMVCHIDQQIELFSLPHKNIHATGMAVRAVDMFFVLSGFLITYLLLVEKNKTGTINFKNFYIRRILRIWPVYYLTIFVTLILIYFNVVPTVSDLTTSLLFYMFLMANISYLLRINLPTITPLWSVGVEEQFYLIWPYIVKKTKKYLWFFSVFFLGGCALRVVSRYTLNEVAPMLVEFLYSFRINIMALGAFGAYLVYSNHKFLNIIFRRDLQLLSWCILLFSIIYHPIHIRTFVDSEVNSIFYLIIILNVACNPKTVFTLENKVFDFFGRISYGIYMYHMVVIYVCSYIYIKFNMVLNYYMILAIIVLVTLIGSYISFVYFETPFLKMKKKFMVVKSTNKQSSNV